MSTTLLLLASLSGCSGGGVSTAYDTARERAMASNPTAPIDWTPDARVAFSRPLVDTFLAVGVSQAARQTSRVTLPGATLSPEVEVDGVRFLAPHDGCRADAGCFPVEVRMSGRIAYSSPLGNGQVPMEATLAVDLATTIERVEEAFEVRARPADVRSVDLTLGRWRGALKRMAQGPLETYLDDALSDVQPFPLGSFGEGVPLRAMKVRVEGGALFIDLSTSLPVEPPPLPMLRAPENGFVVQMASDTLLAAARRAAWEAGPQAYGIVPEPTSWTLAGDRLSLGLRLWGGRDWTRDYVLDGRLRAEDGTLALDTTDVREVASSPGAASADPLAHLASGLVPHLMEAALDVEMPAQHAQDAGHRALTTRLTGIRGRGQTVELTGSVDVGRAVLMPGRRGPRPGRKGGGR